MGHVLLQSLLGMQLAAAPAATPAQPKTANTTESHRYDLALDRTVRCQPTAGAPSGDRVWIGFAVSVRSKTKGLFVTARDFSLEKQGIILQPRHVNPPVMEGCLPLLRQKQLNANDEPNQGFVLFEVPARFRDGDVPLTLAYQPTRWGGAARAELIVPACLDQCDSARTKGPRYAPVTKQR